MLSPLGRSAESAVSAGIDCTTRKVATPARTTRIRIPAPVAPPEKRRSPIRRAVRRAGVCEVVVTPAPRARDGRYERWPPGSRAARWPEASQDAPGHRSTGRDHVDVIASIAVWLCSRRASEIGEEPAWSAAAFWPASLTT